MLTTSSFNSVPLPAEKSTKVRILKSLYVDGRLCEVGAVVTMALGDAQCLRSANPPKVEII